MALTQEHEELLDELSSRTPARPIAVLFICLGNICRSPMAKAIFTHACTQRGVLDRFRIDSCGTGDWHLGHDADPRARLELECRGVLLTHRARQVDAQHDRAFDLILAMDQRNQQDLLMRGLPRERVLLMRLFDPTCSTLNHHELDVPDPYFGGQGGFAHVFSMLDAASQGLLDRLGL